MKYFVPRTAPSMNVNFNDGDEQVLFTERSTSVQTRDVESLVSVPDLVEVDPEINPEPEPEFEPEPLPIHQPVLQSEPEPEVEDPQEFHDEEELHFDAPTPFDDDDNHEDNDEELRDLPDEEVVLDQNAGHGGEDRDGIDVQRDIEIKPIAQEHFVNPNASQEPLRPPTSEYSLKDRIKSLEQKSKGKKAPTFIPPSSDQTVGVKFYGNHRVIAPYKPEVKKNSLLVPFSPTGAPTIN